MRLKLVLAILLVAFTVYPSLAAPLGDLSETLKTKDMNTPATTEVKTSGVLIDVNLPDHKYASMGNGPCGQYAMGIVLDSLGLDVDMDKVMSGSNPGAFSFTSPSNVLRYMQSQGVETHLKNKSELKDIVAELDAGKVCMVMVSSGNTAHWVAITGYEKDAQGNVTTMKMSDSAWGNGNPKTHEMDIAEFNEKWHKPLKNYGPLDPVIGYDHLLVTFDGKDSHKASWRNLWNIEDKLGSFDTAMNDAVFGGANSVLAGWERKDPVQIVGGAVQALGGATSKLVFEAPASILNSTGNFFDSLGDRHKNEGGVEGVLGHIASGTGTVLNAGGTAVRATGNAITTVWNGGCNLVKGIFGGF